MKNKKKKQKLNSVLTLRKAWTSLVRARIKAEAGLCKLFATTGEPELDADGFSNLPSIGDDVEVQCTLAHFRAVFLVASDSQVATDLINRLNQKRWAPVKYSQTGWLVLR